MAPDRRFRGNHEPASKEERERKAKVIPQVVVCDSLLFLSLSFSSLSWMHCSLLCVSSSLSPFLSQHTRHSQVCLGTRDCRKTACLSTKEKSWERIRKSFPLEGVFSSLCSLRFLSLVSLSLSLDSLFLVCNEWS